MINNRETTIERVGMSLLRYKLQFKLPLCLYKHKTIEKHYKQAINKIETKSISSFSLPPSFSIWKRA